MPKKHAKRLSTQKSRKTKKTSRKIKKTPRKTKKISRKTTKKTSVKRRVPKKQLGGNNFENDNYNFENDDNYTSQDMSKLIDDLTAMSSTPKQRFLPSRTVNRVRPIAMGTRKPQLQLRDKQTGDVLNKINENFVKKLGAKDTANERKALIKLGITNVDEVLRHAQKKGVDPIEYAKTKVRQESYHQPQNPQRRGLRGMFGF